MEMVIILNSIVVCCFIYYAMRAWKIWWMTPKKLEKHLREQGFSGNSYKLIFGDQKEISLLIKQALSKPINITDDIEQRVLPHVLNTVNTYGT